MGLRRFLWTLAALLPLGAAAAGCARDVPMLEPPVVEPPADSNPDWTTASHGTAAPDYAMVFPADSVNTLHLAMTREQWSAIQTEVSALFGVGFGGGGQPGQTFPTEDPAYVDVGLHFKGKRYDRVGFRLKGNSSLSIAWRAGKFKLPFRLKMDEFASRFPRVRGQRLYGFRELSFSPAVADPSLIRERLASEFLNAGGVPAARTAFYRVFIDFGGGSRYVGLYTAVEAIDDTFVATAFGEDDGNLYKPTSTLQTFVRAEFEKKNNRSAADYTDVEAFVAALHAPTRSGDPAAWRAALEARFDVDHFLRWLALNTAMVNWDSYGTMAQNYYLYRHPTRGLVWIPWDHNEAFTGNPPISQPGPTFNGLSLALTEVGAAWPLVRFLADDPVYAARYRALLREVNATVLHESEMHPRIDRLHQLVTPWAVGPEGEFPTATHLPNAADFSSAAAALRAHVSLRRGRITTFVP